MIGPSLLVGVRPCPDRAQARLVRTLERAIHAPWYGGRVRAPRLDQFPILERKALQAEGDSLLVGDVPRILRRRVTTGGSTGAPVALWLDRAISLSEWRYMTGMWAGVGYRAGDWRVVLRGHRLPAGKLVQVNRARREIRLSTFALSADTLPKYLRILTGHHGAFLHAYPSASLRLASLCKAAGRSLPRFRALLLGSEGVTAQQLAALRRAYDTSVFTWYGMTEKVLLGGVCPYSGRYHLHPDYGVAEIVDAEGRPIDTPGVTGRLLGTGLLNRCAPLVRYDTGDLAAWAESCECGFTGQLLERVAGRSQDEIETPGGVRVSLAALNLHDDAYIGVRQLQYAMGNSGRLSLRVVAEPYANLSTLGKAVGERLPGLEVVVERVDYLPPAANGKVPLLLK